MSPSPEPERREDCVACRLDVHEQLTIPLPTVSRVDRDEELARMYPSINQRIIEQVVEPAVGPYEPPPFRTEPIWAAIDLDGTLAGEDWTPERPISHIGPPIVRNVERLLSLHVMGYKIVIHTARPWFDYENIEAWLLHHKIPFHRIVCGKLWAAVYIDDRGRHASAQDWRPYAEEERLA